MNTPHPTLQNLGANKPGVGGLRPDKGIRLISYSAGSILFSAGESRDNAYLIDSGTVDILGPGTDGPETVLARLGAGEVFGEMALIDGGSRSATATVSADADLFVIPRGALKSRVQSLDPVLSLLIALLIERYRTARIHLPESVREDQVQGVAQATGAGGLPDDLARLSDLRRQKDVALKELKLEQDIRRGIDRGEFVPALQPILSLPERKLAGFETLIRWNHPDKGMVFPDAFIPVAERTGLIQYLDRMMLQAACDTFPSLLAEAGGENAPLFISVNLSGINFETLNVIQSVRETLVNTGLDPHRLKLEITESALIDDPDKAEQVLKGLKALGVTIALDDFGTGYSSLGYLHRFSIDSIKIDRSFVSRIHDAPRSLDIVRAIVGLARNFKLDVIAEGIETEQDVLVINSLGCEMGQGYLFAKPLPMDQISDFIRKHRA